VPIGTEFIIDFKELAKILAALQASDWRFEWRADGASLRGDYALFITGSL
jgi:hypothetical protein